MAHEIKVNAELRHGSGSSAARRFRRAGAIPAVLAKTGGGSELLSLNAHAFEQMLSRHLSDFLMVTLDVGGTGTMALLREVQRHGLTGKVIHADFSEVDTTKSIRVRIPVVLVGEPEGVRTQGGILEQMVREIDVMCLPQAIVEKFEVDVSALKLSESLMVRDIALGDGFTVITHADVAVATVIEVKEEASATATAAEAAATPAAGAAPAATDAKAADAKAAPAGDKKAPEKK
ncbi:MAG: 50S ribosomal protein L25 [Kiritimatiellaeota bacterium]|nr:50S ribosomal protein L25 [Kiritimatiellota bacterium]